MVKARKPNSAVARATALWQVDCHIHILFPGISSETKNGNMCFTNLEVQFASDITKQKSSASFMPIGIVETYILGLLGMEFISFMELLICDQNNVGNTPAFSLVLKSAYTVSAPPVFLT